MATATLKLLSCLPDKKESHSDSFLKNRDLPLNVLSFLQWNIHNECFLSCQETKLPGHCDASYPHCKENATEQLRSMLTEGNGALDFAGVEQMADEQLATNQVDVEWGQIYHTCGGENGFGAAPFDIAMLLYRKSKWEVKQVNGTFLQPFGGCMERADGGEGPTNYRAFLGQAFVHKHSRFEVLVVVAHFPHIKRYSEEILRLSAALTSFRASSGVNQVVLIADTNRERTAGEIMADIYPNVTGVVGSAQQKTCCYPIYLHAFDRVIAGGFPAKEASMKTIFPFGTEGGHQPPAWATVNMHDPIIVEFSLGKLSVGGERLAHHLYGGDKLAVVSSVCIGLEPGMLQCPAAAPSAYQQSQAQQFALPTPPQWQAPPLPAADDLGPPPKRQTDQMPTPASIENQKQAYARALDQQLESGTRTINEQKNQAMEILRNAAEEKKMKYMMQLEEQLLQQEFELDEQCHQQIMQLQQAAFQQKSQLEHQASTLIMEFKQRQMQEDRHRDSGQRADRGAVSAGMLQCPAAAPSAYQQSQAQQFALPTPPQWQAPPLPAADDLGPPPKRQTDQMPTPASIENQKQAYARALDQQLESGTRTINEQKNQAMEILRNAAEEKKMKYMMQLEEQLLQQEFELDEQCHQQIMQLQQAAFQQKSQLEHQASTLIMEFKQRQMQEQLQNRLYQQKLKMYQMRQAQGQRPAGGQGPPQ
ncbi:unnamed protein product [Symbiodinium natans]|uniref:Uncharacterized protein n=1 Tax=Symbiodinium natans TaxID=878477 RepID=A0A812K1Z2_9DINO|nr:unnamed protein product [Symbiodinium natans]